MMSTPNWLSTSQMKKTKLGKMLGHMRVQKGIHLGIMAKDLQLTSSYLSGIELGRIEVTESMIHRIAEYFELDANGTHELMLCAGLNETIDKAS